MIYVMIFSDFSATGEIKMRSPWEYCHWLFDCMGMGIAGAGTYGKISTTQ